MAHTQLSGAKAGPLGHALWQLIRVPRSLNENIRRATSVGRQSRSSCIAREFARCRRYNRRLRARLRFSTQRGRRACASWKYVCPEQGSTNSAQPEGRGDACSREQPASAWRTNRTRSEADTEIAFLRRFLLSASEYESSGDSVFCQGCRNPCFCIDLNRRASRLCGVRAFRLENRARRILETSQWRRVFGKSFQGGRRQRRIESYHFLIISSNV